MKRVICAALCMVLIIIYSCERDDFCLTNPATPNFIIRFYDINDEDDTKNVDILSVWAEGKDTISDYSGVSTDSIALPLNTTADSTTYHLLSVDSDGTEFLETLTIKYTTEDEYISRSCGFRVIFNDVTITRETDSWISQFLPNSLTTINNQESAHVEVYH